METQVQRIFWHENVSGLGVRRSIALVAWLPVVALVLGCQQEPASTAESTVESTTTVRRVAEKPDATRAELVPNVAPLARIAPRVAKPRVPKVLLTTAHAGMCVVKADDRMPAIKLPTTDGEVVELSGLFGETLTVVCFWKGDRALAQSQLADLGPDVVERFSDDGVKVVGIAVEETPESAEVLTRKMGAKFPTLIDSDGQAFSQVGKVKLPRTYLLDAKGTILWFDIEYSRSTRRELNAAIRAILQKDTTANRTPLEPEPSDQARS